jgi:hypothetical protein
MTQAPARPIVFYGAGSLALVLNDFLDTNGYRLVAILSDYAPARAPALSVPIVIGLAPSGRGLGPAQRRAGDVADDGGERPARLLVADQEPDQHVDAGIGPRRGDVAAQLLRLIREAHALEAVGRVRLQPVLGDPEVQVLAREGRVEALDQARQVGEGDVVRPGQLSGLLAHVRAVRVVRVDVERRMLLPEQQREAQRRDGRLIQIELSVTALRRSRWIHVSSRAVRLCPPVPGRIRSMCLSSGN